jgi:hypothetical protein
MKFTKVQAGEYKIGEEITLTWHNANSDEESHKYFTGELRIKNYSQHGKTDDPWLVTFGTKEAFEGETLDDRAACFAGFTTLAKAKEFFALGGEVVASGIHYEGENEMGDSICFLLGNDVIGGSKSGSFPSFQHRNAELQDLNLEAQAKHIPFTG